MLITTPNLTRPDESYAALIATHDGLSEAESHALNARLILILMNLNLNQSLSLVLIQKIHLIHFLKMILYLRLLDY